MAVSKFGIFHILSLTLFLIFLALGFIYEWKVGAMNW
jgi:NADH:ubiquinone oxidoreductase subunit 3 (subunit A)